MKDIIITNNPMVNEYYKDRNKFEIIYLNGSTYLAVMLLTRDKIHLGHKLLTHPLSGSIKPNETPYKTIVVSKDKTEIDFPSLSLIEDSVSSTKKFLNNSKPKNWNEKILNDFQLIDFDLIHNAI